MDLQWYKWNRTYWGRACVCSALTAPWGHLWYQHCPFLCFSVISEEVRVLLFLLSITVSRYVSCPSSFTSDSRHKEWIKTSWFFFSFRKLWFVWFLSLSVLTYVFVYIFESGETSKRSHYHMSIEGLEFVTYLI